MFIGVVGCLWARPVLAWGNFGHMLVAASAWDQLSPTVKDNVDELLQHNPEYKTWVANAGSADPRKVAFMMAARWPDWIKVQKGYTADGPNKGDTPPKTKTASQNIGYKDMLMHKYWHFINEPFKADKTPTKAAPKVNAETEIALLSVALRSSKTDPDIRSYDLVWLEHLVGDVHQPLHCTSRFDSGDKKGDAGGNLVKITGAGTIDELHSLWDEFPGTEMDVGPAITGAKSLPTPDPKQAAVTDAAVWINESFVEAQKSAYVAPIELGNGPFAIDAAYTTRGKNVSAVRISLAGARLANLLNAALN